MLHCDACGAAKEVGHGELGIVHARYLLSCQFPGAEKMVAYYSKGLSLQQASRLRPLTAQGYHAAVNRQAGRCVCGGAFKLNAPARCPKCRARWSPHDHGCRVVGKYS